MNVLETALQWRKRGIPCIPVRPSSKEAAVSWREFQTRLPLDSELQAWFGSGQYASYGILTGWQGLTVVDFDDIAAYLDWQDWALKQGGVPECIALSGYQVVTDRGVHVYVYSHDRVNSHFKGGDVKQSGYVLGAGSKHPKGATYQAIDPDAPILPVDDLAAVFPGITEQRVTVAIPSFRTRPVLQEGPSRKNGKSAWDTLNDTRTSDELIETARQASIVAILGLKVKASGTNGDGHAMGVALCPWHDDHDASLSVDLTSQRVYCFRGCAPGGLPNFDPTRGVGSIDAAMWAYNLTFWPAVRLLANGGL